MPETANIARMAEIVSSDVFSEFGWERSGPMNENWDCVLDEHGRTTHPADVVFWYKDPYSEKRIYVMLDLKSYARSSISKTAVGQALRSLAIATECSQLSDSWRQLFCHRNVNYQSIGLLFIYNHDGAFDNSFKAILSHVSPDFYQIRAGNRMYVFGPRDICYLNSISNDIRVLRGTINEAGRPLLPPSENCSFYYPDLYRRKVLRSSNNPATIETLSGPWQVLKYHHPDTTDPGYFIYYRGTGTSPDEFLYLIDYFFHYQLLQDIGAIEIRSIFAANEAAVNFRKAIEEYTGVREGVAYLRDRLERVTFKTLSTVTTQFSTIEIGMNNA